MFRLISAFMSIVAFAAVVWFGVTVELGERTLFGHLRAIGSSPEVEKLVDGTKEKVTDFVGIEAARRAEAAKEAFKNPDRVKAPEPGPAVDRAEPDKAPAKRPAEKARPTAKDAPAKPAAKPKAPDANAKAVNTGRVAETPATRPR